MRRMKPNGVSLSLSLAAAAKSLQLCPTLCNPTDGSPPGSSVPGILQARILEWVAISFSNACMHAKSLQSCLTLQPYGQQPTMLLCPWDSPGKNTGVGCHFLLLPVSYLFKHRRDLKELQNTIHCTLKFFLKVTDTQVDLLSNRHVVTEKITLTNF